MDWGGGALGNRFRPTGPPPPPLLPTRQLCVLGTTLSRCPGLRFLICKAKGGPVDSKGAFNFTVLVPLRMGVQTHGPWGLPQTRLQKWSSPEPPSRPPPCEWVPKPES